MEVSIKNSNMIRLLAFVVLCLPFVPELMTQETEPVELTQSDLFSLPNWRGRTVAVDCFLRGMTRAQAVELAGTKNLTLVPSGPVLTMAQLKEPCVKAARCSVGKTQGNSIGINLFFDAEKVTKIEVGLSADMYPEVKKDN